ncbi:IS3 family transposase [Streptomyces sp. NBC_01278]|uniref:IS3 family transposase n=1 Tax=Streptomyces sp. NBC_01278 TaxID=2903809 RepID=UPI003FCCAF43
MNRCQFVEDLQRRHGVKRLCDILGLPRSSFYYWRRTAAARAARQTAEFGLAARIRKVHQDSDGTYGAPRITAELRDEGGPAVNHKRVARIMRTIGIEGIRLRRRHRTTVADQSASKAPDLIGRDFTAAAVNTKYVGDITYLPVSGSKHLYLATVIDLCSRRLAGWAIADHMRTELVIDALTVAERTRGSLAGAIMHTDHGSQYSSRAFAENLQVNRRPAEHGCDRVKRGQRRRGKLQRRLQEQAGAVGDCVRLTIQHRRQHLALVQLRVRKGPQDRHTGWGAHQV